MSKFFGTPSISQYEHIPQTPICIQNKQEDNQVSPYIKIIPVALGWAKNNAKKNASFWYFWNKVKIQTSEQVDK